MKILVFNHTFIFVVLKSIAKIEAVRNRFFCCPIDVYLLSIYVLKMGKSEAEKRIEKKREELAELEGEQKAIEFKVAEARAYLAGMEDNHKLHSKANLPKGVAEDGRPRELRGLLREIQTILQKAGKPMHIEQILNGLNREKTNTQIKNVCSQLDREVRTNGIFLRPSKRTYALIEYPILA